MALAAQAKIDAAISAAAVPAAPQQSQPQRLPHTLSTNPPSERTLDFETCRMNEEAGYVIEIKVGAGVMKCPEWGTATRVCCELY